MGFRARAELPADDRARLDAVAARIDGVMARAGYAPVALPVIQPAELYLDMAGEEIRDRLFLVTDPAGNELCLRADLTLPLCRHAIDTALAWPARLSASGPVFRHETSASALPAETLQASAENLGADDPAAAEADVFALAREAIGAGPVTVEIGDLSLFPALLADLALDEAWARRLAHGYRHPSLLPSILADGKAHRVPQVPSAFAGKSASEIERFVAEKSGGAETVAGRPVREIAARLAEKARLAASSPPPAEDLARIAAFLAVECAAGDVAARLRPVARPGGRLAAAVGALLARIDAMRGVLRADDEVRFSAVLGRAFLYYTGTVFEMRAPMSDLPLAAGGRYDRLLSDLGAARPVPAVGCALWPERLLAAGAGP